MIIDLNILCDIIAEKYQIPREEIFLKSWFPIPDYYYSSDLPIGKGDASTDRFFLPFQYSRLPEDVRELDIAVFQNKKYIMYISVKTVSPNQNKVHKLMDMDSTTEHCGGGYYNYYPFFSINGCWGCVDSEDEKTDNYYRFVERYSQFLEKTEIDTKNITTIELITTDEKGFVKKIEKIGSTDALTLNN